MKHPDEINIKYFKNYKNLLVRIVGKNESVYCENSFQNYDQNYEYWKKK